MTSVLVVRTARAFVPPVPSMSRTGIPYLIRTVVLIAGDVMWLAVLSLYTFNGWYIGMQNTTIPMVIAILINLVNIALSILFVNTFHMGVTGVALGTVIAQYAEKSDIIIIAWGSIGNYSQRIRDRQDELLEVLEPYAEKLYQIGTKGFHPLTPSVRTKWDLQKYDLEVIEDDEDNESE